MKRVIFSIGLCFCIGFTAIAQDSDATNTNKRGVYLLPEAGNFAIGIDAEPIFYYLGNFFSTSLSDAPYFDSYKNTVYGKYFLRNNRALRTRLAFGMGNTTNKSYVTDHVKFLADPTTEDKVIDIEHNLYFDVEFGIGYEFRRGKGRVQGFYGGEISFGAGNEKQSWCRGNYMTSDVRTPFTCTNFTTGAYSQQGTRTTEIKSGTMLFAGLSCFVGAEYFFAPKISIGGEFGLGVAFSTADKSEVTTETWNATDNTYQVKSVKSFSPLPRTIAAGKLTGGKIFIMFHF